MSFRIKRQQNWYGILYMYHHITSMKESESTLSLKFFVLGFTLLQRNVQDENDKRWVNWVKILYLMGEGEGSAVIHARQVLHIVLALHNFNFSSITFFNILLLVLSFIFLLTQQFLINILSNFDLFRIFCFTPLFPYYLWTDTAKCKKWRSARRRHCWHCAWWLGATKFSWCSVLPFLLGVVSKLTPLCMTQVGRPLLRQRSGAIPADWLRLPAHSLKCKAVRL